LRTYHIYVTVHFYLATTSIKYTSKTDNAGDMLCTYVFLPQGLDRHCFRYVQV